MKPSAILSLFFLWMFEVALLDIHQRVRSEISETGERPELSTETRVGKPRVQNTLNPEGLVQFSHAGYYLRVLVETVMSKPVTEN